MVKKAIFYFYKILLQELKKLKSILFKSFLKRQINWTKPKKNIFFKANPQAYKTHFFQ